MSGIFGINLRQALKGLLAVGAVALWAAAPLYACTEGKMLEFIGSLEAPEGYNQVYGGVRLSPPRAITSMTVGEVIAWQRQASKTAVSSAAGRYQIIRATLQGAVDQGVVGLGETFDPATQDRIGLSLLRQTGYTDGATSPAVANRISGIWAAVPQISGANAGASTYEGIAGNHALVDAGTYSQFLACQIDIAAVQVASSMIRAGLRFGMNFDMLIEAIMSNAEPAITAAALAAQTLLLSFFAIDLVWRGLGVMLRGTDLGEYVADTMMKVFVVFFFYVILTHAHEIVLAAARYGAERGEEFAGREGFSLGLYAHDVFVLMTQTMRGVTALDVFSRLLVNILNLGACVCLALIMAKVVFSYAQMMLQSVAGVLIIAAGGLSAMGSPARKAVMRIVAAALEIIALNLILYIGLDLVQAGSDEALPVSSSMSLFFLLVFIAVLIWTLPASVARLAKVA